MSLHTARLSKILKIAYAPEKLARTEIFNDVSGTIRKENRPSPAKKGKGGDFHSVLWAVFKSYIFEENPIESFRFLVNEMIEGSEHRKGNEGRRRLYTLLGQGLIKWGTEKRRWLNEDIKRIKNPTAAISIDGLNVAFKVNNILALEIVGKGNRYIYPYFSEEPELSDEAARVALWYLHKALPDVDVNEIRTLDVMRGESFGIHQVPFQGNEHELFEEHATRIIKQWESRYAEKKAA